MTMGTNGNGNGHVSRDVLEQRANVVLSQMLRRLDVLDERRQHLKDAGSLVKYEVKRHLPVALAIGAGTLALGVIVTKLVQARREREFRRQVVQRLLARFVGDGAVERPARPGVVGLTLRSVGLRLLLLAASEVGRRFIAHAAEPHRAEPRALPAARVV